MNNTKELQARLFRDNSINQYISTSINTNNIEINNDTSLNISSDINPDIKSILKELEIASTYKDSSTSENTISLQLSSIVDQFIRTLEAHEQYMYIRRYFYIDSLSDIANTTDTTIDVVNDILNKCNAKLHNILSKDCFIVKSETLLQCFTDITDDLIRFGLEETVKFTGTTINHAKKENSFRSNIKRLKVCIATIGLSIACIIAFITINILSSNGILEIYNTKYKHLIGKDNDGEYIITSELLKYKNSQPSEDQYSILMDTINFTMTYLPYELTDTDILKHCLGNKIEEFSTEYISYYTLLGHKDINYIISVFEDKYTLLKMQYFALQNLDVNETTKGPYNTILNDIYDIYSTKDIAKITYMSSNTVNLDNSEAYEMSVTDTEKISSILDCLMNLKYTTIDIWDLCSETNTYSSYLYDTSITLTIHTAKGDTTQCIYYNYIEKYFFNDDGMVFIHLSDDYNTTIDEFFNVSQIIAENKTSWNPDTQRITVSVAEPSNLNLILIYSHAKNFIDGLYISDWYEIEQLEGDSWVKVTPRFEVPDKESCNPLAHKIYSTTDTYTLIVWSDTYYILPSGRYRIITSVCNMYEYLEGDYNEQLYYTEFTIK